MILKKKSDDTVISGARCYRALNTKYEIRSSLNTIQNLFGTEIKYYNT